MTNKGITTMQNGEKWDKRFMRLAQLIASWSKDPSTKVGVVVIGPDHEVRSTGYNGPPRLVDDEGIETWDREYKLRHTAHAELNAVCNAARVGVPLTDCTMYATMPPCSGCACAIIQAGIKRVVALDVDIPDRWVADIRAGSEMMEQAFVRTTALSLDDEDKEPDDPART
jgi:dCMP deaminase